jgi:hypothetical protein
VTVIVDQPASLGALPLTSARDAGCTVAYLPGLAVRRTADLYPGEAETDAKDSAVIADAVRTMPHTLRSLELTAESTVLVGFDQGLAAESTHTVSWDPRSARRHPFDGADQERRRRRRSPPAARNGRPGRRRRSFCPSFGYSGPMESHGPPDLRPSLSRS